MTALERLAYLQAQAITQQQLFAPSKRQDNILVRSPLLDAPDNSSDFIPAGAVDLPAVAATDTLIMSYQVPVGYDGIVRAIMHYYDGGGFVQGSGDILWRIFIDGKPVKNFEGINTELGSPRAPFPLQAGIKVYGGQTISYYVCHVANGALSGKVVAQLVGYIFPTRGRA